MSFSISTLMFATLIAALVIGAVIFLRHMRKAENRHPMEGQRERNEAEIRAEGPDANWR